VKLIVLDACVAVKWYLPRDHETLVEEAFELLELHKQRRIKFATPDSFWAEFGNVMWKAVRQERIGEIIARIAIEDIRAWGLEVFQTEELLDSALTIAITNGRSFYDSVYVALAAQLHCEMITADEHLVNALGSRFPVRWLGSFQQMH
jgi:predicted nucleic acid-binding protein